MTNPDEDLPDRHDAIACKRAPRSNHGPLVAAGVFFTAALALLAAFI